MCLLLKVNKSFLKNPCLLLQILNILKKKIDIMH